VIDAQHVLILSNVHLWTVALQRAIINQQHNTFHRSVTLRYVADSLYYQHVVFFSFGKPPAKLTLDFTSDNTIITTSTAFYSPLCISTI